MNNFMILLKKDILLAWGAIKWKKKKGRVVSSAVAMVIAGIVVIGYLGFYSVMLTIALSQSGSPQTAPTIMITMTLFMTVMIALMRTNATTTSNDSALLLSLPIRKSTIILSKSVSQYAFDAATTLLFLLPMTITYFIINQSSIFLLLRGILIAFLIPLLPVGLAHIVSFFFAKLKGKFKSANLINLVLMMLFFVGFMFFSMNLGSMSANPAASAFPTLPPIEWVTNFFLVGDLLGFLFLLALTCIPFAIGVMLYTAAFGHSESKFISTKTGIDVHLQSSKKTLLQKELKRYFSCTMYVFNTAFGAVLSLFFAIFIVAGGERNPFSVLVTTPELAPFRLAILALIICFFPAMTCTTAVSISLEGKTLWILQAHPIKVTDIFWAKIMVNVLVNVPASIISCLIVGIGLQLPFLEVLSLLVYSVMIGVFISVLGLWINLMIPRLDWENENIVIKQSMSVVVCMLIGMAIVMVMAFVYFIALAQILDFAWYALIASFVLLLATLVLVKLLATKGVKIFHTL